MDSRVPPGARRDWLVAGAAALLWLGFSLGLRRLALPDEGRYVGVAWEMLRSGNWLVPTLDGLPFFHKPPLFYWLTAGSLAAFGANEWAARAASLAGALVAALSIWALYWRWTDRRLAGWVLVALATQPMFFGAAQFANLDMLVAGCITLTIACAAHAVLRLEAGAPQARAAVVAAWTGAALGVLAKGLIGVVLPGLVLVLWLTAAQRTRWIPRLLSPLGLLAFAVVAAPWFVAMQQRFPDFFHYFFVYQHFERYTHGTFNNPQPFWFYVAVVAVLTLPWFGAARAAWRLRRAAAADPRRRLLRLLLVVWLVVVVAFFSIPRSKLVGYVLPALPPLAALIADGLWTADGGGPRALARLRALAAVAVVLCVGALAALLLRVDDRSAVPLAAALKARKAPADAVVFAAGYFYDVPFYAGLDRPVQVAEGWTAVDIAERDNWRKEIYDASRFAPTRAATLLVERQDFEEAVCANAVSWVVAARDLQEPYAWLRELTPVATTARSGLWRIDRALCAAHGKTVVVDPKAN